MIQGVKKDRTSDDFFILIITVKHFLSQLNIPVRKLIPDEVVEDVSSHTKLKLVKVFSNFTDSFIEVVENPAVCNIASFLINNFFDVGSSLLKGQTFIVHKDIARDVPNLVNEVP